MRGSLIGESPWYQLFIVFLIAIAGTFVFLVLGMSLVPVFFPLSFQDLFTLLEHPSEGIAVEVFKFLQGFNTMGTFLVPGLLGAYLLSRYPSDYLEINDFPRYGWAVAGLVLILTLSGTVLSDALYRFSSEWNFPESWRDFKAYLDQSEALVTAQLEAFLRMRGPLDFIEIFVIMAVLPAVCEETLFRGIIQPLFIKGTRNVPMGIIITSLIFGALHQQFYSFLSITALSVVLGFLKEWSRSLWVPVLMHLINNGTIVIAVYFFNLPLEEVNDSSSDWQTSYFWPGLLVFSGSLAGLWFLLVRSRHTA